MATIEELQADRAALRSARTSMLTGQSVKEVARDGRRLVFNVVTVESISAAIEAIDRDIAGLEAVVLAPRPRFRALRPIFRG